MTDCWSWTASADTKPFEMSTRSPVIAASSRISGNRPTTIRSAAITNAISASVFRTNPGSIGRSVTTGGSGPCRSCVNCWPRQDSAVSVSGGRERTKIPMKAMVYSNQWKEAMQTRLSSHTWSQRSSENGQSAPDSCYKYVTIKAAWSGQTGRISGAGDH